MTRSFRDNDLSVELDVIPQINLPPDFAPQELPELAESVLIAEGASGIWSVAVVFTDDASLRTLHRDFMGIDTETDVMTFPADNPAGAASKGGDIVISVERAADHAANFHQSAWEESRFLVVHGLLHLCGWADETDEQRSQMLARQAELLELFEKNRSTAAQ